MRWNVSGMARQFITGRNPEDAMKVLRKAAQATHRLHRRLVRRSSRERAGGARIRRCAASSWSRVWPHQTKGWTDPLGRNTELFPVVNLSVKISALYSQMNPADPEDAIEHLAPKLRPILRRAKELGAFVNFDMESYAHKNSTLELFKRLFTEAEFKNWPHAGIVIQAYLRDAEQRPARPDRLGARTRHALHRAARERRLLGLREDQSRAERLAGVRSGCRSRKATPTSKSAPASCSRTKTSSPPLSVPITSAASRTRRPSPTARASRRAASNFSSSTGWPDPIKRALVEMGYRVREYCPVGELLPGMAYLVRRLLENTSNEGFLAREVFRQRFCGATAARSDNA